MRVAVLSDIHANLQALDSVLDDCASQKVDRFWMLGDYVDYGASCGEVLKRVASLHAEHAISGNHDACLFLDSVRPSATPHGKLSYEYTKNEVRRSPEATTFLRPLAETPIKMIAEQSILLVHGTPQDPYWGKFSAEDDPGSLVTAMREAGADTMFMGHSHVQFMLTRDGKTIINPGSVGQPRNGCPDAQYVIWEEGQVTFRRVSYAIKAAAAEIRAAGLPEYLWKRLFIGS